MSDWKWNTIIEPFKVRSVEPIPLLSKEERTRALKLANYNLFAIPSNKVTIDLLTDSGTGAMSTMQWSAMMCGDESYAGSQSFSRLYDTVLEITSHPHIFPVHQGRAAERILGKTLLKKGDLVLSNTHFDTTRANIEAAGAEAVDIPVPTASIAQDTSPFKGNLSIAALKETHKKEGDRLKLVILTLTNNAVGGHPVSLHNINECADYCTTHQIPLVIDAARFAENAWFIQSREPACKNWSINEICRACFERADAIMMSAKKDGMVNIGGLLTTRRDDWAEKFKNQLIIGEGFTSYGGLAGRDIDALAVGLKEAMEPDYLRYRAQTIQYCADQLERAGVPVVRPTGGHAVYIDAGTLAPHLSPEDLPGQSVACALYEEGGIRGVEVGELMFPGSKLQLVRLAFPRRVYTQAHVDYVAEVGAKLVQRAPHLPAIRIREAPPVLRHFSAKMEPITARLNRHFQ
jgi:tyrosine phenol-lyase